MAAAGWVRWVAGKVFTMPPRQSRQVDTEKGLRVPMGDGVELLADVFRSPACQSSEKGVSAPVILIRSTYGRGGLFGLMASLLAERGLQVVVQSVRGTCGSDGEFDPMQQERRDGADTVTWLKQQPWCTGPLYTFGMSYLGNVQWAMARDVGDQMDGLVLGVTLSNFRDELRAGAGLTQAGTLGWTNLMLPMTGPQSTTKMQRPDPNALTPFHNHLPLGTVDQKAFGKTVSWWQDWINHDLDDPWWEGMDHSVAISELKAPTMMVAGWRDIFLPSQLKDFQARQDAGQQAWLTVGPWTHSSMKGMFLSLKEAAVFFTSLSHGQQPYRNRDKVRLYVQGANKWRDYPSWPPPCGKYFQLHLRSGNRLDAAPAATDEGSVNYTYNPADPTPSVHGPQAMGGGRVWDMTELVEREDTVQFTGETLQQPLETIGPVTVKLSVRCDREHTDFYVCLCDVDKKGRSLQVSDGYIRLSPEKFSADAEGIRNINIDCWPTAYQFKKGHRLRLIIAGGAHPRYARNLGLGEPLATATEMVVAQQEIMLRPEACSVQLMQC